MTRWHMLMARLPHPLVSLCFLFTALGLFYSVPPLLTDPDMPWHLATGALIAQTGQVPKTDSWSYATSGEIWYNLAWLWDLGLYGIEKLFGLGGVFRVSIFGYALLTSLLCWSLLRRKIFSVEIIGVTVALLLFNILPQFAPRPTLITCLLAWLFHMLLHESRERQDRRLWLLPVLMVAWVNLHGGFFVGFTILGAYGLEALYLRDFKRLRQLLIISMDCLIASMINPYTFDIYHGVWRTFDSVITTSLLEWRPFAFGQFLGFSIVILLLIVMGNTQSRNVPPADRILALAWLTAALMSARHNILAVLLAAPYLAYTLDGFTISVRSAFKPRHAEYGAIPDSPIRRLLFFGAAFWMAAFLACELSETLRERDILTDPEKVPEEAVNYVLREYPNTRFYNDYNSGSYLIFFGRDHLQVAIDPRAVAVYSEAVLQETVDFQNLTAGWEKLPAKYHAQGMFLAATHPFHKLYDQGQYHTHWQRVYESKAASIYLHK